MIMTKSVNEIIKKDKLSDEIFNSAGEAVAQKF